MAGAKPLQLNDMVRVKLTEAGLAHLQEHQAEIMRHLKARQVPPHVVGVISKGQEKRLVDGWYQDQLWEIFAIFGGRDAMHIGGETLFSELAPIKSPSAPMVPAGG